MNTSTLDIVNRFNEAAREGDIDLLYTLIDEEPEVLDELDAKTFIETPLHVAACAGKLQFATEIKRLKPSFAWKLNKQGYCPIHLALQHNQTRMVQRFIDIDENLVRARGREGFTPLHIVTQNGDVDMLANFLKECPFSIRDVTVRGETALHIAVKHNQFEALQVLVSWLKKTRQRHVTQLEDTMLNWKDEEGNTVLHISALSNDSQALGLLINTGKMDLQAKNFENQTVLDISITTSSEMKDRLMKAGAKPGPSIESPVTLADKLRSADSVMGTIMTYLFGITTEEISGDQRDSLLVVATLVAAATYQSGVNPPGGFNSGDDHQNPTSSFNNTTTAAAMHGKLGKSVLPKFDFQVLSAINGFAFILSISFIFALAPNGTRLGRTFVPLIVFMLLFCYVYSVLLISPENSSRNDHLTLLILYAVEALTMVILLKLFKSLRLYAKMKGYVLIGEIKSGKGEGNK